MITFVKICRGFKNQQQFLNNNTNFHPGSRRATGRRRSRETEATAGTCAVRLQTEEVGRRPSAQRRHQPETGQGEEGM